MVLLLKPPLIRGGVPQGRRGFSTPICLSSSQSLPFVIANNSPPVIASAFFPSLRAKRSNLNRIQTIACFVISFLCAIVFIRPFFLVVHDAGSTVIERSSVLLRTAANSASPNPSAPLEHLPFHEEALVPTVNIPQNVLAIPAVWTESDTHKMRRVPLFAAS